MPEVCALPTMFRDKTRNAISLPVQEKSIEVLGEAVAEIDSSLLVTVAINSLGLAEKAEAAADTAMFFTSAKCAYLILERILREGGRI